MLDYFKMFTYDNYKLGHLALRIVLNILNN